MNENLSLGLTLSPNYEFKLLISFKVTYFTKS